MEVEDTLGRLVDKSLVTIETTKSADCSDEKVGYAIHNLQLDYMLETCKDITARHKKLVEGYKKACCRGWLRKHQSSGRKYLVLKTYVCI